MLFFACSEYEEAPIASQTSEIPHLSTKINRAEATAIADRFVNARTTRNDMGNSHSYDYILASGITTRAQSNVPDTLAYIINYPDNGGFAIIATDTRVYPF